MKELIELSVKASLEAGKKILEVYAKDFAVETKADSSPLTEADKESHNAIDSFLSTTGIPVLSEEAKQLPYEERKSWTKFWLVDPLDGTKEFIKKNGEFTVNIALIENGEPVMGVVYIPVTGKLYFGSAEGSFSITVSGDGMSVTEIIAAAEKLPNCPTPNAYTIVASRSHNSKETEDFIAERKQVYNEVELISSGSSIKLCLVAEGKAHVYPRLAPTMEWDTGAGHAVAKFAGCKVYNYENR